jgi:cytohesin
MAELLLKRGADVMVRNKETSATPLHEAAMKGHADVVRVLLAHGADPNAYDSTSSTPLDEALRYRHRAVVGLLMDKSGKMSQAAVQKQMQDAIMRGQIDMVALLLEKGADANARTAGGGMLLHDAALKGHREIAELLVSAGANINALNSAGGTPLHDAALGGHAGVVALLLSKGADASLQERETGATALHHAASWGRTEALELLLKAGADPNVPNKFGTRPLKAAIANGHIQAADLLRRYKARE